MEVPAIDMIPMYNRVCLALAASIIQYPIMPNSLRIAGGSSQSSERVRFLQSLRGGGERCIASAAGGKSEGRDGSDELQVMLLSPFARLPGDLNAHDLQHRPLQAAAPGSSIHHLNVI